MLVLSVLALHAAALALADPAPFVVAPTGQWDGDDGLWSTFSFEVGTPFQQVRMLPSTSGTSFAPIFQQACTTDPDPQSCPNGRGQLFNPNASATWSNLGTFQYALTTNFAGQIGDDALATYGQDTVRLAWPGTASPTLNGTLVSGLGSDNLGLYRIGQFGLSSHSTNLSSLGNSYPTVLNQMKEAGQIPSLSFGYTAGSRNREPPAFGSLVLGGFDQSKFRPNTVNFLFPRDGGDVVAGLQRIAVDQTGVNLLPNPIYVNIDSQIPTIVLPVEACRQFENAFNLTYNPIANSTTGYYFINDTQHQALLQMNPSFTFSLGPALAGGPTVQINLPYTAFDLQLTPPLGQEGGARYFPLQQAANSTQYVLGRTFLQYAYLTVDFERSNFSVSQALFAQNQPEQLRPIASLTGPTSGPQQTHSGLSGGAIAGIVIGVLAAVALLAAAAAFLYLRRRRARKAAEAQAAAAAAAATHGAAPAYTQNPASPMSDGASSAGHPYWANTFGKVELGAEPKAGPVEAPGDDAAKSDAARLAELESAQRHEIGASEGAGDNVKAKVEEAPRFELDATSVPAEMASAPVEMSERKKEEGPGGA